MRHQYLDVKPPAVNNKSRPPTIQPNDSKPASDVQRQTKFYQSFDPFDLQEQPRRFSAINYDCGTKSKLTSSDFTTAGLFRSNIENDAINPSFMKAFNSFLLESPGQIQTSQPNLEKDFYIR